MFVCLFFEQCFRFSFFQKNCKLFDVIATKVGLTTVGYSSTLICTWGVVSNKLKNIEGNN